jgi:hypothetical protein
VSRFLAFLIAVSVSAIGSTSLAAPQTIYFNGQISAHSDLDDPSKSGTYVGTSYLAWMTFDVALAETFQQTADVGSGQSGAQARTITFGLPDDGTPLVTDYQFVFDGGTFAPISSHTGHFDFSTRSNSRSYPDTTTPSGQETYHVGREQSRNFSSGNSSGDDADFTLSTFRRYLYISMTAFGVDQLLQSATDLDLSPNFSAALDESRLFTLQNSDMSLQCDAFGCAQTYFPDSYVVSGSITSLLVLPGEAQISLPGVGALLAAAYIGCLFANLIHGTKAGNRRILKPCVSDSVG